MIRYIFTVTTGRSGQAALADVIARHVPDAYAAFEEPSVQPYLPRVCWGFERRFRRRFIETDELLGRGKVLRAYANGDDAYLARIAWRRQRRIIADMMRRRKSVYVDVSKFFARGLHRGWEQLLPEFSLIRLIRDPVSMLRSFLNRHKNFTLDNNLPDAQSNILRLDSRSWELGELYLWSWCELYLRCEQLIERGKVSCAVDMRTEDLDDPVRTAEAFAVLGLSHTPLVPARRMNTNVERGLGETCPAREDIVLFERFLNRIPPHIRSKIRYLDGYDPYRWRSSAVESERAATSACDHGFVPH